MTWKYLLKKIFQWGLSLVDWALAFSSFIIATQHPDNPLYCFIPAAWVVLAIAWTHQFGRDN